MPTLDRNKVFSSDSFWWSSLAIRWLLKSRSWNLLSLLMISHRLFIELWIHTQSQSNESLLWLYCEQFRTFSKIPQVWDNLSMWQYINTSEDAGMSLLFVWEHQDHNQRQQSKTHCKRGQNLWTKAVVKPVLNTI